MLKIFYLFLIFFSYILLNTTQAHDQVKKITLQFPVSQILYIELIKFSQQIGLFSNKGCVDVIQLNFKQNNH
jgi:hypothetical protein